MANKPRIKLPESAAVGDVIEVRTLVNHVMETGNRKDKDGNPIPRNIINAFVATYAGQEVFRATLGPGVSANPFIAFYMRVPGPGEFEFTWTEDSGEKTVERAPLTVAG